MQYFCMDSYQLQHYKDNSRTQTISSKKKKTLATTGIAFFFFFSKKFPSLFLCMLISEQADKRKMASQNYKTEIFLFIPSLWFCYLPQPQHLCLKFVFLQPVIFFRPIFLPSI